MACVATLLVLAGCTVVLGGDDLVFSDGAGGNGSTSASDSTITGGGAGLPTPVSVTPSTYWNDEAVEVTITGSGFAPGARAFIGGVELVDVVVVDEDNLRGTLPPGLPEGPHVVEVRLSDVAKGQCPDCFVATNPVVLSGMLKGRVSYPDRKVVIAPPGVRVEPYNGVDNVEDACNPGESGCLEIEAAKIVVLTGSVIDARSSGYFGRPGGGGGGGGTAVGGAGAWGGAAGAPGQTPSFMDCSSGGNGGGAGPSPPGSAPFGLFVGTAGGAGGPNGSPAAGSGGRGGYAAIGVNGDATTDATVRMGSGGGGGGGGGGGYAGNNCCEQEGGGGGGGGGAGGRGGGFVRLIASVAIVVEGNLDTSGTVDGGNGAPGTSAATAGAQGKPGGAGGASTGAGTGNPGAGGPAGSSGNCPPNFGDGGASGGSGGAGAGGGIALQAPAVHVAGTLELRGGQAQAQNGGTLKILTDMLTGTPTAYFGRSCQGPLAGPCM